MTSQIVFRTLYSTFNLFQPSFPPEATLKLPWFIWSFLDIPCMPPQGTSTFHGAIVCLFRLDVQCFPQRWRVWPYWEAQKLRALDFAWRSRSCSVWCWSFILRMFVLSFVCLYLPWRGTSQLPRLHLCEFSWGTRGRASAANGAACDPCGESWEWEMWGLRTWRFWISWDTWDWFGYDLV